jgi:hypothetical protein
MNWVNTGSGVSVAVCCLAVQLLLVIYTHEANLTRTTVEQRL